jgi:hypothetical protein
MIYIENSGHEGDFCDIPLCLDCVSTLLPLFIYNLSHGAHVDSRAFTMRNDMRDEVVSERLSEFLPCHTCCSRRANQIITDMLDELICHDRKTNSLDKRVAS